MASTNLTNLNDLNILQDYNSNGPFPKNEQLLDLDSELIVYSDIDFNLTEHPYTNDIKVKTNIDSIRQSMRSLLRTKHYSRYWHPEVGSFFQDILFSQSDQITMLNAQTEIQQLFEKYEPRIRIQDITFEYMDNNPSRVKIVIYYVIIVTDQSERFEYIISRTR